VRALLNGHGAIPASIHARLTNGLDLRSMTTLLQFLEPKELAIEILSTGAPEELPAALMWPYLTAHFDVLDQALGQIAAKDFREPPIYSALTKLSLFPKLPARYFN